MSYILENVTQKEVNTKFGPKPAFTIVCGGERYSYGFKKPMFNIGDEIDFQFTENTYGKNVDLASVQLVKKGTGAPVGASTTAAAPVKAAYSPPSKVFPIPALHGDRAIVRQNSVTNATKLVSELLTAEDTADLEEWAEKIISIARKFEAYSCGDLDAAAAEALMMDKA